MEARKRGVGRYSGLTHYAKSLGYRYRRRLARIDADDVADLIRRTIAVGYVGTLDAQAQVPIGISKTRDIEAIWNYWIIRILSDMPEEAMSKKHVDHVEKLGTDFFSGSARDLGLKPLVRGNFGARALGMLYVRAGVTLRLVQSEQVPDAALAADPLQVTNGWRWLVRENS